MEIITLEPEIVKNNFQDFTAISYSDNIEFFWKNEQGNDDIYLYDQNQSNKDLIHRYRISGFDRKKLSAQVLNNVYSHFINTTKVGTLIDAMALIEQGNQAYKLATQYTSNPSLLNALKASKEFMDAVSKANESIPNTLKIPSLNSRPKLEPNYRQASETKNEKKSEDKKNDFKNIQKFFLAKNREQQLDAILKYLVSYKLENKVHSSKSHELGIEPIHTSTLERQFEKIIVGESNVNLLVDKDGYRYNSKLIMMDLLTFLVHEDYISIVEANWNGKNGSEWRITLKGEDFIDNGSGGFHKQRKIRKWDVFEKKLLKWYAVVSTFAAVLSWFVPDRIREYLYNLIIQKLLSFFNLVN